MGQFPGLKKTRMLTRSRGSAPMKSILREMANSVVNFLEFTYKTSEGPDRPVPCLDTQVWFGQPDLRKAWFQNGLSRDKLAPGTH